MRRVILDVDTGTDDAVAIMAAALSPELVLEAVCTVHGNTSVENTTENSLRALQAVGRGEVPVFPGAAGPLAKDLTPARALPVEEPVLSGGAVIGGQRVSMNPDILPLPASPCRPQREPAACYYLRRLRAGGEKLTLVATGALTNLALALTIAPDIIKGIEEIVIMGGGVERTNITAAAEVNFFKDPEAAARVLGCGAPVTLCTLDATHSCALTEGHEARLRAVGGAAATFTANDVRARRESYAKYQPLKRAGTAPIHDALCVAWLLDPAVATEARPAACRVDCSGGISEGRLQVDTRHFCGPCNVNLITGADPDRLCDLLVRLFARCPGAAAGPGEGGAADGV